VSGADALDYDIDEGEDSGFTLVKIKLGDSPEEWLG
jgi:hypothetical protein